MLLGDGDGDGDDNDNNTVVAGSAAIMALPPAGMTHAEIQLNRGIERFTPCVEDKTVVPLLEQRLRVEIKKASNFFKIFIATHYTHKFPVG